MSIQTDRDAIGMCDERRTERMSFCAEPHIEEAIQKAAALCGVEPWAFAMNAAYDAAIAMITAFEHTTLQQADIEALFVALDRAPAPTDRLRTAFARHKLAITSK